MLMLPEGVAPMREASSKKLVQATGTVLTPELQTKAVFPRCPVVTVATMVRTTLWVTGPPFGLLRSTIVTMHGSGG